jgi:hypothetical protein
VQELEVFQSVLLCSAVAQAARVHGPKRPPRQDIYMPVSHLNTWGWPVCQSKLKPLNACPCDHQPVVCAVPVRAGRQAGADAEEVRGPGGHIAGDNRGGGYGLWQEPMMMCST